ncbi:MAG: hypothetical protein EA380_00190, partial [Phycisphaeraceae bacterium]
MLQRVLCVVVSILAAAQLCAAKPPAFSDLMLEEAIERGKAEGREVVVYWYTEGSFGDEVMRELVWSDPEVEAWLAEHAIAVWVDRGRTPSCEGETFREVPVFPTSTAVFTPEGAVRFGYEVLDPECVIRFLSGEVTKGSRCASAYFYRLLHLLYVSHMWNERITEDLAEWCIFTWERYPLEVSVYRGRVLRPGDFIHVDSFVEISRRLVEQSPEYRERLGSLRDALKERVDEEPRIIELGHWLALSLDVFDDQDAVLAWIDETIENDGGMDIVGAVFDFTGAVLERENRWALYGDALDRSVTHCADTSSPVEAMHRVQDHLLWNLSIDRPETDSPESRRWALQIVGESMQDEVRRQMVLLARERHEEVGVRLAFAERMLVHYPEAFDMLISRADEAGLLHPLHLPYLDTEREDHRAMANRLRAAWPDAEALAEEFSLAAAARLGPVRFFSTSVEEQKFIRAVEDRYEDELFDFAHSGLMYIHPDDRFDWASAAAAIEAGDFASLVENYFGGQRVFGELLVLRWREVVEQDQSLAEGLLRF